jgi:ubiquinone/menaquinone biosynthesis C-methylase UbiE
MPTLAGVAPVERSWATYGRVAAVYDLVENPFGPSGKVAGIDLSARMLGRARRRVTHARSTARVAFIQGDAHRLPAAAG